MRKQKEEISPYVEEFKQLLNYVNQPIHMILCIGKEGIFVEYNSKEHKIKLGNHNGRSIKINKDYDTLLLYFDSLFDKVSNSASDSENFKSNELLDIGYIDYEKKIYLIDLNDLSYDIFKIISEYSDSEYVDDFIDLYNILKYQIKNFIQFIKRLNDGF